jgi:hypothetical protein
MHAVILFCFYRRCKVIAMSEIEPNAPVDRKFADLDSPATGEVKQLISQLEHSHHLRYKMMNLEAWALAETMDSFLPGFWSRFLENRRIALKQFLERKRAKEEGVDGDSGRSD